MDINTILIAVASVTVIGVVCAAVLCIASKFMNVKVDERVEQLQKSLPGVNCGVCGFPGCSGYAAALLSGTGVRHNLCTPGGSQVLAKISAILGVKAGAADSFGTVEKKTAVVHCAGDCGARQKKWTIWVYRHALRQSSFLAERAPARLAASVTAIAKLYARLTRSVFPMG